MKNYYEILEIDKNASEEIIDKSYKVLVKKYHPDLQTDPQKKLEYEAKIKLINEAYDTISNSDLRAEYDSTLVEEENVSNMTNTVSETEQENYENAVQEEIKRQAAYQQQQQRQWQEQQRLQQQKQQQQYQDAINKAYHDAYIQDLKNRGYKIKYKKTFNDYLHSLIALLITIGVIALIIQIPFVKNYFYDLYLNNEIIKNIVDAFGNIFK